jgi:hypothetical protein
LAKACGIVCCGLKNEAVHLWKNMIIQILVGMGIYIPTKNVMPQKDAVVQYLNTFAAGHHVPCTSLQNQITLGQVGLALMVCTPHQ